MAHFVQISRSHYRIARRFMLEHDLLDTKTAVLKMIEMASATHAAEAGERRAEQRNGRASVPGESR